MCERDPCVSVCVCVCEREREPCVCVCVSVCLCQTEASAQFNYSRVKVKGFALCIKHSPKSAACPAEAQQDGLWVVIEMNTDSVHCI